DWDQRGVGFPRIVNGIIDIGAYEVQDGECAAHPTPRLGAAVLSALRPDVAAVPSLWLALPELYNADKAAVSTPTRGAQIGTERAPGDGFWAARAAEDVRLAWSPTHVKPARLDLFFRASWDVLHDEQALFHTEGP